LTAESLCLIYPPFFPGVVPVPNGPAYEALSVFFPSFSFPFFLPFPDIATRPAALMAELSYKRRLRPLTCPPLPPPFSSPFLSCNQRQTLCYPRLSLRPRAFFFFSCFFPFLTHVPREHRNDITCSRQSLNPTTKQPEHLAKYSSPSAFFPPPFFFLFPHGHHNEIEEGG